MEAFFFETICILFVSCMAENDNGVHEKLLLNMSKSMDNGSVGIIRGVRGDIREKDVEEYLNRNKEVAF